VLIEDAGRQCISQICQCAYCGKQQLRGIVLVINRGAFVNPGGDIRELFWLKDKGVEGSKDCWICRQYGDNLDNNPDKQNIHPTSSDIFVATSLLERPSSMILRSTPRSVMYQKRRVRRENVANEPNRAKARAGVP
jgi:hypothetical protein